MVARDRSLGGEDRHDNGGPLFGRTRASDPETSREAAARVAADGLCAAVLEVLRGADGLTSLEVSAAIAPDGVDPVAHLQSVSPRFAQLRDAGLARVKRDADGGVVKRDRRQVWEAVE